jgi:hypothetical protein
MVPEVEEPTAIWSKYAVDEAINPPRAQTGVEVAEVFTA